MRKHVRWRFAGLILVASISMTSWANGNNPQQLSIVLRINGDWNLYVSDVPVGQFALVPTIGEPRSPTTCREKNRVAYISSDGSLRQITLVGTKVEEDRVLLESTVAAGYAQPAYGAGCERLFVVELKQGKSVDTNIVEVTDDQVKPVVAQRSAQFEPYINSDSFLYYASVSCVISCGQIIQEIWRMQIVSGVANQLTLTNAVAREPVANVENTHIYFSSNRAGHYHIWELSLEDNHYRQLTTGEVVDSAPAVTDTGSVYFVRQSEAGYGLLVTEPGQVAQLVSLPDDVTGIRDLKVSIW